MEKQPFDQDAACRALADSTRRAVLERLSAAPSSVNDLAATMPVSRPAVSQHLKVLKDAGLVEETRVGKYHIYAARPESLEALATYLQSLSSNIRPLPPAAEQLPTPALPAQRQDPIDEALSLWPELWPSQDPASVELGARLLFIAHLMNKAMERTAEQRSLSRVDMMILGTLKRLGPPFESTPTNLAQASLLSPPATSKRLNRLEALGLLERRQNQTDRRSVTVRLTKAGHEVIDDLLQRHYEEYISSFQLATEEQAILSELLRKLQQKVEERVR